jgi:hypothetical protein
MVRLVRLRLERRVVLEAGAGPTRRVGRLRLADR